MSSVHPRCNQHGLVAPDGMCVLCRKQASSAPPSQPRELRSSLPLIAAMTVPASTDKCAALLVGLALMTFAATYVLDTTKTKELAASQAQQQAETERLQAMLLAANEAEDQPMNTAVPTVHAPAGLDIDHQDGRREPE